MTFVPVSRSFDEAVRRWGWDNLTADELRCLWVVDRFLAERNQGWHRVARPAPIRQPNSQGFLFATDGEVATHDGAGLASLVVAGFQARVRVAIRMATVWSAEMDDPEPFLTNADCRYDVQRRFDEAGDRWEVATELFKSEVFPTREEAEARISGLGVGVDPSWCVIDRAALVDIAPQQTLVVHVSPRDRDDGTIIGGHPGVDRLVDLIAECGVAAGTEETQDLEAVAVEAWNAGVISPTAYLGGLSQLAAHEQRALLAPLASFGIDLVNLVKDEIDEAVEVLGAEADSAARADSRGSAENLRSVARLLQNASPALLRMAGGNR